MDDLQKIYACFATPSYLYSNKQKKTNISPEFCAASCNMIMYYVDNEGEYKKDPLFANLFGKFYPLTCVDNLTLTSGVYIETQHSTSRTEHYKISSHDGACLMAQYPGFVIKHSELDKYIGCSDYGYKTVRDVHEPAHRVISIVEIYRCETMSKFLVEQVETIDQKDRLIAALTGVNKTAELTKAEMASRHHSPVYRPEPVRETSMGFKEAAGMATTALTLVKLGLSVGKQLR